MSAKVCSVDDCDEFARCRGWCNKHYTRWRVHGDPNYVKKGERWIRSLAPEGVTPARYKNASGYVRLRWRVGPQQYVECYEHRWVAGCLDPDKHVHHLNGVKDDNRPENLEVIDPSQHTKHHHPPSFDVEEAKRMYEAGMSTPEIGRALGVDHSNVYRRLKASGFQFRTISESLYNLRRSA